MELVSSRNIDELVFVLKQEITKTHNTAEHDDTGKYRQLLVRTLHTCSIKVGVLHHFLIYVEYILKKKKIVMFTNSSLE